MDLERITELPGMLRAAATAIENLPDFADLPRLYSVGFEWDDAADTLKISAQCSTTGDDFEIIAGINTWAAALGGVVLLGDEVRSSAEHGYYWRNLSTVGALPGGLLFEVWAHLIYPIPAPGDAPELLSA